MHNNRSQQRPNSPHRINVLSAVDDAVLGRLVNITSGGLMFLAPKTYERGTILSLRIPLPTMANGKTAVEADGLVIWTQPDDNPRFQRIGIQFPSLGAEEGYLIETVLQRLHLVG
ncbi:MAG TPA: PilZ domain-containing protein [Candidatus Krumholzibacteria bacterium]|nr:PilZ domain-containing protein [Candidatus Krumholzibacteria bacterium]HPD72138.1 PilZ domain-containing protein [Candidatus Krumholzibacteria bacterium]HRY40930.1 PilZ domain-containing protein [Candidatus Krumholzibacteria bacterium]